MQREFKISLSQEYYSDTVYLSQYDSDYNIIFNVVNKYAAADVDGCSAKFLGKRSDGLGFTFTTTGVGSTLTFAIDNTISAVAGTHTGEVVIYNANGLYFGSANVQIVVEEAAQPDGTIDADVERAQELAEQIQEIVDTAAETVTQSIADAYSSSNTYAVGDYCIYNNTLYRCTTAITTAEAWTSGHWTAVDVMDEVTSVKSDLTEIFEDYLGLEEKSFTVQDGKHFINSAGTIVNPSGTFHLSDPIAVTGGTQLHFIATGHTSSFCMIATCDSEGGSIVTAVNAIYDGAEHDYVYDVGEDGYVMLSFNYSYSARLFVLSGESNLLLYRDLTALESNVNTFCGMRQVDFINLTGKKFMNGSGVVASASGTYHVTKPIAVTAGEEVHFIARGNTSGFTMIATCDSEGSSIVSQVRVKSDGLIHDYVYDVEEDGYVMLSYDYSYSAKLVILSDISNLALDAKISGAESEISEINDNIGGVVLSIEGNLINQREFENNTSMSSSGVETSSVGYVLSGKIPLKANTEYSYRNAYRINFFDSDDTHLSSEIVDTGSTENTGTFTTGTTTSYCRMTCYKGQGLLDYFKEPQSFQWQLVEGSALTDYETQRVVASEMRLYDNAFGYDTDINRFRRWNKICFDKAEIAYVAVDAETLTAEDKTTAGIYAKYDALMSDYPEYITKTSIGTASDGTTMYRYDFKMPNVPTTDMTDYTYQSDILPKIICASGSHPEFGGIYGLYNAMREIATNDDLKDLKYGVHFICIPVINPYGVDNLSRANANDIDMSRNYEVDYVSNSGSVDQGTWSGTTALSEPEPQAIDTVMSDNSDAILFISCHSFNSDTYNRALWGSCATRYMANLAGKLYYKMSRAWNEKYPTIVTDSDNVGWVSLATEPGSEGKQAAKYGIQGIVLETGDKFGLESSTFYTSFCLSRNAETYLNFFRIVLNCFESSDPKDITMMQ